MPGSRDVKKSLDDQVAIRRAALKDLNRAVGFPTITFPCEMASNLDMETLIAGQFIAKYGGIVVLSDFSRRQPVPAAAGTVEHLYRSPAAHDRDGRHL
jgi:acetyl-CoA decarbonylase/synthase complex subunit gamma